MLMRRLFGHETADITMEYFARNCDMAVEGGLVRGGFCLNSSYAGAKLRFRGNNLAGVAKASATVSIDKKVVESVLRKVVGNEAQIEFPVDTKFLIQAKISNARKLIIKASSYWELIYLNIVASDDEVHAVIEALYSPGLGDSPPPHEAFKGNTEAEFPLATRDWLRKVVNSLADDPGAE
jgi:hypothetical protein